MPVTKQTSKSSSSSLMSNEIKIDIGKFWTYEILKPRAIYRLSTLESFYTDEVLRDLVVPFVEYKSDVSLRTLDWCVTNYALARHIVLHDAATNKTFNVYFEYKSMLKMYTRRLMDPFARHSRIYFACGLTEEDGKQRIFETTVGQLNFLHWAVTNNVLNYTIAHAHEIGAHMKKCMSTAKEETSRMKSMGMRPRRKPYSRPKSATCAIYKINKIQDYDGEARPSLSTNGSAMDVESCLAR